MKKKSFKTFLLEKNKHPKLLAEGLSSVLYHSTSPHNALLILKANALKGSYIPPEHAEEDLSAGHQFFISFARSRSSSYLDKDAQVVFELDGRKLSQKYTGVAVDYNSNLQFDPIKRDPSIDEMEDRLYLDEPELKPLDKYLKAIHVVIPVNSKFYNQTNKENQARYLGAIREYARRYSVPIYVYDSKQAFFKGVKAAMHHGLEKMPDDLRNIVMTSSRYEPEDKKMMFSSKYDNEIYQAIMNFLNNEELNYNQKRILQDIAYNPKSFYINFLNNARRPLSTSYKYLNILLDEMKKHKIRDFRQLIDYIKNEIQNL